MYIVEGNIGVGKSTFLTLIKQLDPSIDIILEPKDNWANRVYGQSLLANFYEDPHRWAYTIETLAMICRTRDHIREQHHINHRRIAERSIYSGHYVFATNDYANGYLSDLEWEIYHKWVNFLVAERCRAPFGFIYLRATPENCFKRVKKRSRISEKNLTLSYIKQLDAWHEKFLIHKDGVFDSIKDTPVLILDCNDDFVENKTNMEKHLKTVNDFFERTYSARQNTDVQASNHTLLGLTAHTQKVLTS